MKRLTNLLAFYARSHLCLSGVLGFAFVASIAACAPSSPGPRTDAETAKLLASTDHVWMSYFEGAHADLTYAVPETDAVLLALECDGKADAVIITGFVGDTPSDRLRLSAGDASVDLAATSTWDEAFGGYYATAEAVPLSNPVVQALKHGREISAGAFGPFAVATPLERREIDRFFAFCGR